MHQKCLLKTANEFCIVLIFYLASSQEHNQDPYINIAIITAIVAGATNIRKSTSQLKDISIIPKHRLFLEEKRYQYHCISDIQWYSTT